LTAAEGFVKLMRPANSVMMGFAVIVGVALADPNAFNGLWLRIFFGFVTSFTLTAASMAINDYVDRAIDAINEPHRPIPSGQVSSRSALGFAAFLSAIGFAFAYITSLACFAVAIIAWLILVSYVTFGKRTGLLGNFMVSACVAIPFLYGSIIAAETVQLNVLLFAAMAFLSNTGREIIKGIVDIQGDASKGVKTLAVRYGEKYAALSAVFFLAFAVALSPLPLLLHLVSLWFIPFVTITDVGLFFVSYRLVKDPSRGNAKKLKRTVLICFLAGLLAFIFGTVG
jgi:geranylgeranylglycerol-phosphate geranylgeranyltransferase